LHQHIVRAQPSALVIDARKVIIDSVLQLNVKALIVLLVLPQWQLVFLGLFDIGFSDLKSIHSSIPGLVGYKGDQIA